MSRISGNLNVDGNLNIWTSATITSSGVISASEFRDYNYTGGKALVSDALKNITESSTTSAQIEYLNTTSANIQTQLTNLSAASVGHYTTTVDIIVGVQAFTINHNLGYLRPSVRLFYEASDQEIFATPVYINTNQLSLPITSTQAFSGTIVEVVA